MTPRLVLPIPPNKNHSHRQVDVSSRLRRIRSADTRQFVRDAQWLAIQWMRETGWRMPETGEKVILRYWVWWPDARRRDAGNLIDVLADALEGILYPDDRWLLPRAMDYAVDRDRPRVEVEVWLEKGDVAHGERARVSRRDRGYRNTAHPT